jgi:hypothetical protein
MRFRANSALFFATDLTNFLACRHFMALERLRAHELAGGRSSTRRGLIHERAYVEQLARLGKRVVEID